jgi:hypothetical protein
MTHLFTFSPVLIGMIGEPGVDWLYQFTNNLTNLTTQNSDALSSVGMTLLAFVSFIKLVRMVAEWNLSTMTVSLHPGSVRFGDLVEFLVTMTLSLLIINYWATPFPGAVLHSQVVPLEYQAVHPTEVGALLASRDSSDGGRRLVEEPEYGSEV